MTKLQNAAMKSILGLVLCLVCLLMLMPGTSEAKGGRRGSHSTARRSTSHRSAHKHKHKHKHKRKHKKDNGDDEDGGGDGGADDGEDGGDEGGEVGGDEASGAGEATGAADAAGGGEAAEATEADEIAVAVYGVEITALFKGTAAKQGLEIGDIILQVNGVPTPSYEALASALAQAGGRARVLVIREDGDSDAPETVTLYPEGGRIGVSVEPIRVD